LNSANKRFSCSKRFAKYRNLNFQYYSRKVPKFLLLTLFTRKIKTFRKVPKFVIITLLTRKVKTFRKVPKIVAASTNIKKGRCYLPRVKTASEAAGYSTTRGQRIQRKTGLSTVRTRGKNSKQFRQRCLQKQPEN